MRKSKIYSIRDLEVFKNKLLIWAKQFGRIAYFDSNNVLNSNKSKYEYSKYKTIAAIGCIKEIVANQNCFDDFEHFSNSINDWLFGYFSYDLKNEVESLNSKNLDRLKFPELHFFQPQYVFCFLKNKVEILFYNQNLNEKNIDVIFQAIETTEIRTTVSKNEVVIKKRISKKEYIEIIEKLQQHIKRGDIYEANFCQEFFAKNAEINPYFLFSILKKISPTPFSCFYKFDDKFLISASPERYLKKIEYKIFSQPIKVNKNLVKNQKDHNLLIKKLKHDPKERAENIMIVDLVRNDLSRTACKNTVKVEELCGIYSFAQVHHMISTVVSKLQKKYSYIDLIKYSFPMGSMTGAPKIRAMELIEQYEKTKRSLYSGAVGYISPSKDFDFNVVIRSFLYNESEKYLSFQVGSAITDKSLPEKEYEECLLKAEAMIKSLNK